MPLHPQAKQVLDLSALAQSMGRAKKLENCTPEEARKAYRDARHALSPPAPNVGLVEDLTCPGPGGDIPLRYYRSLESTTADALPVLVYFHGGGGVIGDLDVYDVVCRQMAIQSGAAVFSVDYRLAPEHKFPAAVEDAGAAFRWVAEGAGGRAIDTGRIAVGGDSAGGNLSAGLCLALRETGPMPVCKVLIYPSLTLAKSTPSRDEFAEGFMLTEAAQQWFYNHYINDPSEMQDWRASPLLAEDVSGSPAALILTAGFDPLQDEAKFYADRLVAAGGSVTHKHYDGMIHGFLTMGAMVDTAQEAVDDISAYLRAAFGTVGS